MYSYSSETLPELACSDNQFREGKWTEWVPCRMRYLLRAEFERTSQINKINQLHLQTEVLRATVDSEVSEVASWRDNEEKRE